MSKKIALTLSKSDGRAEIFYSIQGEGLSMGAPAVFVRTSLCNLHCRWCDTDYTWNWIGTPFQHEDDALPHYQKYEKQDWIVECPVEQVAAQILTYPCHLVVLTGGEPLLQQTALVHLMVLLQQKNQQFRFEVETNGTLLPSIDFDACVHQYNVSPKLSNAGMPPRQRYRPNPLKFLAASSKANFKFVVAQPADLQEVLSLAYQYKIAAERIFLMPEGRNPHTLAQRRQWLVEVCKQYGFRYTDRLHIEIWGNKRGV